MGDRTVSGFPQLADVSGGYTPPEEIGGKPNWLRDSFLSFSADSSLGNNRGSMWVADYALKKGFHCMVRAYISEEGYQKFLKDIPNVEIVDISPRGGVDSSIVEHNDFILRVGRSTDALNIIDIFTGTPANLSEIVKHLNKYYTTASTKITNYYFYMDQNAITWNIKYQGYDNFCQSVPAYYPYLDTDKLFKYYFASNESILLLLGKPGTGKSKFADLLIKYVFDHRKEIMGHERNVSYRNNDESAGLFDYKITIVKDKNVLSDAGFFATLANEELDLVIFDDLDNFINADRKGADVGDSGAAFVNSLLSMSDGVMQNKTKFVITTNLDVNDVDTALLRRGRLFDALMFRTLSREEAYKIWVGDKYDKVLFDKKFGDASHIIAADLGGAMQDIEKKIDDSYLLENDISVKSTLGTRKAGFA